MFYYFMIDFITLAGMLSSTGSGKIQQEISESSTYYIAVGNLNSQEVEVICQKFHFYILLVEIYQLCNLSNWDLPFDLAA